MVELNGTWELSWVDDFPEFLIHTDAPMRHRLTARVPEPVHQTLRRHGLLDDPNIGLNSLRARWVEEQFWVYRHRFPTPEGAADSPAWLCFEHLEQDAIVYVNGLEVGRHSNAHRPARFEVTGKLNTNSENTVVVRVDAGLYAVADKPGAEYQPQFSVLLNKRHWQRKGQWQAGWDWQQRLMNVGILGDVRLEWAEAPLLTDVVVRAQPSPDLQSAHFRAEAETFNPADEPIAAVLRLRVDNTEVDVAQDIELAPGWSNASIIATLDNPDLWWPVGHGKPHRYRVDVMLEIGSSTQTRSRHTGVRSVEIDQSRHPETGRHFILRINGKPIFCKGGNWVPCDMMPSTVDRERLSRWTDQALGSHFNLLRIWGGGVWAGHSLLDLCDEKGLLVWHDLLYACSKYPGDDPVFAAEARAEVRWGVRAFAHHPSVVVWCGNNEIEWGDWHWGYDNKPRTHPHYALFHHDFPKIALEEAPHVAYWISSPWSPDFAHPNDPTVGDQHPWTVSLQVAGGADWWDYRTFVDRFPNEGGVLGASSLGTLRQFLPQHERYILSPSWEHHDNPYATNDVKPGTPGHAYQTVQLWMGLDSSHLDWETHAVASGLLQGEGIAEYIANYRRRMFSSSAAVFWMFNDSWPATHGWTTVDYYLRRKLAYHPVRRAFEPLTAVAVHQGDELLIVVVNETDRDWNGTVRHGLFHAASGTTQWVDEIVTARSNQATVVARHPWSDTNQSGAALLLAGDGAPFAQHRVHRKRFHELGLCADPQIQLTLENGRLRVSSPDYVWGVCLDIEGDLTVPDNHFDLLPGVPWSMPWDAILGAPKVVVTGNHILAGRSVRDPV